MSEFFLELFSEEIPSSLQKNLRKDLLDRFNNLFVEKFISFKKSSSYSTPNRLVILFEGVQKNVVIKSEEIKGPSTSSEPQALEGFLKSHSINRSQIKIKKIEKGEFYFYKKPKQKLKTHDLLKKKYSNNFR